MGEKWPCDGMGAHDRFAYPLDSMQKSYTVQGGEHRLCVRVEMAHSHADGWAPEEIGRFAVSRHDIAGIWVAPFQECQQYRCGQDQLFGVGDVSPLPMVVESCCEGDGRSTPGRLQASFLAGLRCSMPCALRHGYEMFQRAELYRGVRWGAARGCGAVLLSGHRL